MFVVVVVEQFVGDSAIRGAVADAAVSPLALGRRRRRVMVRGGAGGRRRVVAAAAPSAVGSAAGGHRRRLLDAIGGDDRDRRHVHASRPRYWSMSFKIEEKRVVIRKTLAKLHINYSYSCTKQILLCRSRIVIIILYTKSIIS